MPTKEGHSKYFTPDDIANLWEEYKKEIDANPDQIQKATNKGVQIEKVKKPYLQSGFYAYVYRTKGHHVHQYFDNYKGAYDDYLGITTHINNEWRADHIEGTYTGRYKAQTLTARLGGYADKSEVTHVEQPLFGEDDDK